MSFHLGKPILILILIALVTGAATLFRPSLPRADVVLWAFADSHVTSYRGTHGTPRERSLVGQFERLTGKSVQVTHVHGSALNIRLAAMFDRRTLDPNQPDVTEVEIGTIGRFLRAPVEKVEFLPLDGFLDRDGWRGRIVESRLAPWSKQGVVFGFPHDVHPVSITYRKDLFDQAGVDLGSAKTWPEFHEMSLRFRAYWRARGYPLRYAMELPTSAADYLVVMLLQRHINAVDDRDQIYLTDDKVAETVSFYARLVAGPRAIGADATPGTNMWARDLARGDVCALFTPDWRIGFLRKNAPELSGKLAMMPLPVFDAGDSRTATWGGTMAGIPRRCPNPETAWKLITFLYSSRQGLAPRWRETYILPPIKDLWDDPVFHEPDSYFGGQKIGELYIELAGQMPRRYWTTFTPMSNTLLSGVLTRAVTGVREGADDRALLEDVRAALRDAADDLRRRIDFARFE
jgi:arabinosaccharide transport system substrate-binding protein